MVQSVRLSDFGATSFGDVACLVEACPLLVSLHLKDLPLFSPIFRPLSRLTGLRSLRIQDVSAPHGVVGMLEPPLHLLHLTHLDVEYDRGTVEGLSPNSPVLRLEDVLSATTATGLPSLRSLTLDNVPRRGDALSSLHHLSSLAPQLSSLTLSIIDDDVSLPGAAISCLSLATSLVSLSLPSSVLDASATALLAALPKLAKLHVDDMKPNRDLSGIPCGWQELKLEWSDSPGYFVRIPFPDGLRLDFFSIDWALTPIHDLHTTINTSTLHKAAQILARHAPADLTLLLSFLRPPPPPFPLLVVPSLAPLRCRLSHLRLGRHFNVDSRVLRQLFEHLPDLRHLSVDRLGAEWSLVSFASAVGPGLPRLRFLGVARCSATQLLPPPGQAALSGVALQRADRGRSLTVDVFNVEQQEVEGLQARYDALAESSGQSKINFRFWGLKTVD